MFCMCCTSMIGAGKSAGSADSTVASALGPPVDTPIATMSARVGVPSARIVNGFGAPGATWWTPDEDGDEPTRQSDRIFGTRSCAIRCCATDFPAVLDGFVT